MTNHDDIDPASRNAAPAGDDRRGEAPNSPYESRRIPPSGDVSPDGQRIWPRPSLAAKVLVWGGTGIAAAALTAGTILAARRLGEIAGGGSHHREDAPRPQSRAAAAPPVRTAPPASSPAHLAPRFADLADEARDAMIARSRHRELEDALAAAEMRAKAAEEALRRARIEARSKARHRARPKAQSLLSEVESNTRKIGSSAESTINSLGAALTGFRAVASQAGSIIGDFDNAARLIRGLLAQGKEAAGQMASKAKDGAHDAVDAARDAKDAARDKAQETADAAERRMHRL